MNGAGVKNPNKRTTTTIADSQRAKELAHQRWGNTRQSQRDSHAKLLRDAAWQSWLDKADGNTKRAENLRQSHMAKINRLSVEARRRNRGA